MSAIPARIARLRAATLERVNECHLDRARLVTESYRVTEGEPVILRRVKALSHFVLAAPLTIYPDELLVGDRAWVQPYNWNFPDEWPDALRDVPPEWSETLGDARDYWLDERIQPPTITSVKGHCVPGFHLLLSLGFNGIAAKARAALALEHDESRRAFLEAEALLSLACAKLGRRFAAIARAMAASAPEPRRAELLDIAGVCDRVPAMPATTFREAVQSLWFGELLVEAEDAPNAQSPGRLDQLLYPYYERDLAAGLLSRDAARQLLACLWLKLWAPYDVHDVVIGGLTPDGRDATNELSELILDVQRDLGLRRQLSVRYHSGMKPEFLEAVGDCIRDGVGLPQLFNDDVLVPNLARSWLPIEAARSYSIIGCIEMTVPGEADPRAVAHYSNLPKCLEAVWSDGNDIRDFDDLFSRYKANVARDVEGAVGWQHRAERQEAETYPMPLLSLLTEGCIESGRDITAGGARYNSSMYCAVGIPNVADSLAAMKQLVFDEGRVALSDLISALRVNFEDAEPLRRMLLAAPKYGNDDPFADAIAMDIAAHYARELSRHQDPRGGPLTAAFFSFTACVSMGREVGATPDGRLAGTPLANSLCAAQGHLRSGPTALLKSAAKLGPLATGGTSLLLDLHPSMADEVHGHDPLLSLIQTYFGLGGTHVEVSFVDEGTLRAAQARPADYPQLTVRVAGYSARFVDLTQDLQEHIIERTRQVSS